VVLGVAARVTSATGDAGASQRVAQPISLRNARHTLCVFVPRMSDTICTTNNRSLSLRKRPALRRGRQLSGSNDNRLDRAAASAQSSRSRR